MLADLPMLRLRQRMKKYLNFYQSNEWEGVTGQPFPVIMIICPNDRILVYVKQYLKTKLRSFEDHELIIHLATIDKIKKFGVTGDVWKSV